MTDQPATDERIVGPTPPGRASHDGLGHPIRYDTEGRIFPESPVDVAIFDVTTVEHVLGELGHLMGLVAPLATENLASGHGTGYDAGVMAMCSLVARLVNAESGGLAPAEGAITALKDGTTTVRDALELEVTTRYAEHLAAAAAQPAPSTGAYL